MNRTNPENDLCTYTYIYRNSSTNLMQKRQAANPHTQKKLQDKNSTTKSSWQASEERNPTKEEKKFTRKVAEIQNGVENKYQRSHRNSNKENENHERSRKTRTAMNKILRLSKRTLKKSERIILTRTTERPQKTKKNLRRKD